MHHSSTKQKQKFKPLGADLVKNNLINTLEKDRTRFPILSFATFAFSAGRNLHAWIGMSSLRMKYIKIK